jgi:hypothetical protein
LRKQSVVLDRSLQIRASLQRLEQSFDFAPDEIANGAKFFPRAIFEGGSAAPPGDAK